MVVKVSCTLPLQLMVRIRGGEFMVIWSRKDLRIRCSKNLFELQSHVKQKRVTNALDAFAAATICWHGTDPNRAVVWLDIYTCNM